MTKAVIFDWDGTLADTRKAVVQSFQTVLEEAGCRVNDKVIERLIGVGTKRTIIAAFKECDKRLDVATLDRLAEQKISIQTELADSVNLLDGVSDLLERLQGKTKIALATMSSRKVVDRLLHNKNIRTCFDVVVTADDVAEPKPDPEVFLVSAQKLGVEPKDCVVIEDSIFGIRASKMAKMRCIAVPTGFYNKEELRGEKPDLLVESLVEKEKILGFVFWQ